MPARRSAVLLALLTLSVSAIHAQQTLPHTPSERVTAAQFEAAKRSGIPTLRAFLERMPKGADLHMHFSGAVYAESFLAQAASSTDSLCIDPIKLAFVKNAAASCPEGSVPAATAFKDQKLYDALVDSFSMRSFVPTPGVSGHDQFFATFARFGGLGKSHAGEWLAEITSRAAAQNEQYLEIMHTPSFDHAAQLGYAAGWPAYSKAATTADSSLPQQSSGSSPAELSALREKLLAAGLRDDVATDRDEFAEILAARARIQHCGTPAALPACAVQVRFLFQVLRAFPPQQVFAQTLLAFEVAAADPNVVGLNFVQPEDAYLAMSEYHRQMLMLDYLHGVYPQVHISLHAGELAPGLVPPAGLRFHMLEAVTLGHAERIGHGVDALYEPATLLPELARRHVMVEINLTSNEVILGIDPAHHPLPAYRAARVPVALSTDDEGVSRIDLTNEYTRAAVDFHLSYAQLKQMARTSLEHAFLPGASLWQHADDFSRIVAPCSMTVKPNPACTAFLATSPRAAQQYELERRFRVFENSTTPDRKIKRTR